MYILCPRCYDRSSVDFQAEKNVYKIWYVHINLSRDVEDTRVQYYYTAWIKINNQRRSTRRGHRHRCPRMHNAFLYSYDIIFGHILYSSEEINKYTRITYYNVFIGPHWSHRISGAKTREHANVSLKFKHTTVFSLYKYIR